MCRVIYLRGWLRPLITPRTSAALRPGFCVVIFFSQKVEMSAEHSHSGDREPSAALRSAWEEALPQLAKKVPTAAYASYIRPIRPLSFHQREVTLGVESNFAREWVDKRYSRQIRSALE